MVVGGQGSHHSAASAGATGNPPSRVAGKAIMVRCHFIIKPPKAACARGCQPLGAAGLHALLELVFGEAVKAAQMAMSSSGIPQAGIPEKVWAVRELSTWRGCGRTDAGEESKHNGTRKQKTFLLQSSSCAL